jgi:leucyl aminopeptidase
MRNGVPGVVVRVVVRCAVGLVLAAGCLAAGAQELPGGTGGVREVWITLAARDAAALQLSVPGDDWDLPLEIHAERDGVVLARVPEERLGSLARAVHERFKRCGGFVTHSSLDAALDALYLPPPELPAALAVSYTLDNAAVAQALIAAVQPANIVDTINLLAANTTRYYTSTGGVNAANQLKARWESYAAGRGDVTVELFTHPTWAQPSVIATIQGTSLPAEVVVLGGHLDSINSSSPATGTAPGADDDASGIASLTEAFRAAMTNDYRPQRTVKFMAYAAEEVGLRGSGEIAAQHLANGINVVGVLQLDMTNYKGSTPDIVLVTDNTNAAQNTFVNSLIDTYLGLTRSTSTCGYSCSDHASWHSRGFVASLPFEAVVGQHNPRIHTVNDTLANSDPTGAHAAKFSRLAAAYMAELAKGGFGGGPPGPVTVTFTSVGAQDGRTSESTETSNVGGSATAADSTSSGLRAGDFSGDLQYRSILSFDTSAIPDTATILSATVSLVRGSLTGTNPFTTHGSCQVDVQTGFFGTAVTLATADFQAAATVAAAGTLSNPASNGATSSATLNAAGLAALNKTGTTQLKIYFGLDDNDDGGSDYIGFWGGEAATAANRPKLTVTYQP